MLFMSAKVSHLGLLPQGANEEDCKDDEDSGGDDVSEATTKC